MITIKSKYDYGQSLYIKNDPDQLEFILVGVIGSPGGALQYQLSLSGDISEVYDFEVSTKRNDLKIMGVDNQQDED